MKKIDLTGMRFGKLHVLREVEPNKYLCLCDCGTDTVVLSSNLRSQTKSCGCLRLERSIIASTKHGMTRTRTNNSYTNMKGRCLNPNHDAYKNYGGRGIKICDRWLESFQNFYDDMGERPIGMTLDRYPNNNGNYEPSNCRWATRKQQANNTRVTNG